MKNFPRDGRQGLTMETNDYSGGNIAADSLHSISLFRGRTGKGRFRQHFRQSGTKTGSIG